MCHTWAGVTLQEFGCLRKWYTPDESQKNLWLSSMGFTVSFDLSLLKGYVFVMPLWTP